MGGDCLYWTLTPTFRGRDGRVVRANLDGSGAVEVATEQATPVPVVADESGAYWLNFGSGAEEEGAVMAVRSGESSPTLSQTLSLAADRSLSIPLTSTGSQSGIL